MQMRIHKCCTVIHLLTTFGSIKIVPKRRKKVEYERKNMLEAAIKNTQTEQHLDPVQTMPAEFENGTNFLRLGVVLTIPAVKKCATVTLTVRV